MSPLFLLVSHNMQQSFTSTAACNIYTPQWFIKTYDLEPNQLNFINMRSKKDTDDIPNRGRTSEKSETNAYMDHSIAAAFGAPEEQDVAVAPSLETTLHEDDAFTSSVASDILLFPKRPKHFHSTSSIASDIRRHNSFHHNANLDLSLISRSNNFLTGQGIASDSLASFQQEDSNIVNCSDICSSGTGSDLRSQVTRKQMMLMRQVSKEHKSRYIMKKCLNIASNDVEESSSPTSSSAGLSNTNISQRDQRASRRNHGLRDSPRVNIDFSEPTCQNTNDHQQVSAAAGGSSTSPALSSVQFQASHDSSNEDSDSLSFPSSNNLGGSNCNHDNSHSEHASNFSHVINERNNSTNMTSPSTDNENPPHHLLFENMRQEEYNLHKHTQGTARFNKEQTACIELTHILDKCDAPKIVFDQIIKWTVEHRNHLSNNPPSRQMFYSKLEKTLSFNKHLPEKIVVELSGNKASEVTRHDPGSSIFSLLTSNDLPTGEKRYIFGSSPDTFTPQTGGISRNDITSSRWFNTTYQKYATIPIYQRGSRKFVMVPIILFIDEMHLDRQGSAKLCRQTRVNMSNQ